MTPAKKVTPTEVFRSYLHRERLVSGGYATFKWAPDGASLWLTEGQSEQRNIQRVNLDTGEVASLLDVRKLRAALAVACGHEPPSRGLPFNTFASTPDGKVEFEYDSGRWRVDPLTTRLEFLETTDACMSALGWNSQGDAARTWQRKDYLSIVTRVPEQLSPSGEWFASVQEHNVALRSSQSPVDRRLMLTANGTVENFWDIEAPRIKVLAGRRVAFGGITPWSPDSLTLLAYRRDVSGVVQVPRTYWCCPFEEVELVPYQKAGSKLDVIQPMFIDVRSRRQIPVRLADLDDRYIQLLGWRPQSREALIIVYTRDFKRLDVFAADRETGAVRALLTEAGPTFVKVWHDAIFSGEHGLRMLPDGSGFVWISSRDGWNHLYHYDLNGCLLGQLTTGAWPVHEIVRISAEGFVYFTASIDLARPYDIHVCRVPLGGGEIEQLTRECGIHSPVFAPNSQAFLDIHSAVDRPTRTDLVRADGTRIRVLSKMDISRLEAVGYTPPEEFTVKAADGTTDLWGVLYKPYNFAPIRSYPVVHYIYAGPQTIETPRFFAIDPTMLRSMYLPWALAQLGYIVVCLDARGTPGRSKAFHDSVCKDWGAAIADHADAITQLCERHPWMDGNRVGIYGHSWGGYFATLALMEAPDTYHAAVAYAPGYNPWDSILYEPYMGLPTHDRVAYERADISQRAFQLKQPLMILAGTSDLHFNSAMRFTRALIVAGIDHECVVVPEAFHHFSGPEEDYLVMKLTGWFDRYVKHREVKSQDPETAENTPRFAHRGTDA